MAIASAMSTAMAVALSAIAPLRPFFFPTLLEEKEKMKWEWGCVGVHISDQLYNHCRFYVIVYFMRQPPKSAPICIEDLRWRGRKVRNVN